jgi:inhibitor of KinA
MNYSLAYRIFPLGDTAITVDFGNNIDETINNEVIARFRQLQQHPLPGMIEAIPAYSSFSVFYDTNRLKKLVPKGKMVFEWMKEELERFLQTPASNTEIATREIRIPVCYEGQYAPDLQRLSSINHIAIEEVIQAHTSRPYKVYMLGFLPGFAYMGEVDERISIPRKPQPENVVAGSVGIAGRQTGIYPFASPGGWQIIGRTPLKLFDAAKEEPTLLKAGDIVQFFSISPHEFENY